MAKAVGRQLQIGVKRHLFLPPENRCGYPTITGYLAYAGVENSVAENSVASQTGRWETDRRGRHRTPSNFHVLEQDFLITHLPTHMARTESLPF